MMTFHEVNQRDAACRRCGGTFKITIPADPKERDDLLKALIRGRIEFIQQLRTLTGCGLADAKGVAHHLTTTAGKCHRCGAAIPLHTAVDCERCGSLNIQLGRGDGELACPACGFLVFTQGYGSYDICPVCGWEDDGVQLTNPTSGGGASRESLAEAQAKAIRRFPLEQSSQGRYNRHPQWRPLNDEEIREAELRRRSGHWHSPGIIDPKDAYWMRC